MHHWFKFKGYTCGDMRFIPLHLGHRQRATQEMEVYDIPYTDRAHVVLHPHFKPYKRSIQVLIRHEDQSRVIGWLEGSGRLETSIDPHRYFNATIVDYQVTTHYDANYLIVDIHFLVDPFCYLEAGDKWISMLPGKTYALENMGTWYAQPTLYLEGRGTLHINSETYTITEGTEPLYIDSECKQVYNSDKASRLHSWPYTEFPVLNRGINRLSVEGFRMARIQPRWREL